MMEHDIEVDYDYADEDETGLADHSRKSSRPGDVDDDEDAVSLGPDEDEPGYYHKDSYQNDSFPSGDGDVADANDDGVAPGSTPHSANPSQPKLQPLTRENSMNSPRNTTSPQRSHSHHRIHGLPPKPVVANVPFLHPSHPSLIEATAMSRSTTKTKTSSGNNGFAAKPPSSLDAKDLPLDWQIRKSHNGDMYYYNTKTHVSTWERPPRNGLQDDKISQPLHFPTSSSSGPKDLSYEDRHYRPGENGAPPGDSRPPVLPPSNRNGTTDTWFGSAVAPSYDSRTPPDSPQHRDRSRSPPPMPQRGRRRRHPNYDGEAVDGRGDSRRPMTPPRRTETDTLQESRRQHRVHNYEPPQVQSKFPMEREKLPARQEPSSRNSRGHPREREPRDSHPQNTTSRHRSPPPSSFETPPPSQRSSKRDRPSRFGGPIEATPGLVSLPPPRIADPPELVPFSNGPKGPPRHSSAPRSTSSPPATEQPSSAARRRPPLPPQEMSFRETSTKSKLPPPPASAPPTSELPLLSTWVERNSNLPPSGPRAAKRNRQVSTSGDVFDDLASTSPSRAYPLPANGYGRESRDNAVENSGNPLPKGPRALRPPTSESAPPSNQGWTRERSPPSMFGAEGHMRSFEDQSRGSMYPHPMERGQGRPPRGRGEFSRPTLSGTNSLPLGSRKSLGGPPPSSSGGDTPMSSGKFSDSRPPDANSGGPPTRKPRNSLGPPDSRMHMEIDVNPRHRVSDNGYPHRMRKEEPRTSPQEPPPNFQRYAPEPLPPSSDRRGGDRNRDEPPSRQYSRRESFSTSPADEHRPATPPPLSREPSQSHSWEGSRPVRYDKERESGRRERFRDREDRVPPPSVPPLEEPARNGLERERERPVSPSTSRLPPGHGLPNKPEGLPPRPRRDDMDVDDGRYRRDGFEERPPLRRGGTLLSRLGGGGAIEAGMKRDRDELGDPADDDPKKRRRGHKSRRGGNGGGKMRV